MRKAAVRLCIAGFVGAVVYAALRWWQRRVPAGTSDIEWTTAPFPFPPEPRPKTDGEPAQAAQSRVEPWVEPNGDQTCPATHPIKAKTSSGIFHVPGGANYERTRPDRCYVDEAAAEADGLRRSKV
jgi:hypothetical protein